MGLSARQTALPVLGATVLGATVGYFGKAGSIFAQMLQSFEWDLGPIYHWQRQLNQGKSKAGTGDGEGSKGGERRIKKGGHVFIKFYLNLIIQRVANQLSPWR